jgi:hypothetical protein
MLLTELTSVHCSLVARLHPQLDKAMANSSSRVLDSGQNRSDVLCGRRDDQAPIVKDFQESRMKTALAGDQRISTEQSPIQTNGLGTQSVSGNDMPDSIR